MNSTLFNAPKRHIILVCNVIFATLLLSSCANFGTKANSDLMAKTTGKDFIISTPSPVLDLDVMTGEKRTDKSVLRLVAPESYQDAFQSNGSRFTSELKLTDPSTKILNSLSNHYKKQYQIRFIAKGNIKNIDEDYLDRALTKGDYLIDIRVKELALKQVPSSKTFYLQASYQLTVFNRKKGRYLLQDSCQFSEPEKANTVKYFSRNNAKEINAFLARFAGPCLNYFVSGRPLPNQTSTEPAPAPKKEAKPVKPPKPAPASTSDSNLLLSVGADYIYYPNGDFDSFNITSAYAQLSIVKPVAPNYSWTVESQVKMLSNENAINTIYGFSLGSGAYYWPSGNPANGYSATLTGQIGQYKQNGLVLSTNAIGLGIGAYRELFTNVVGTARYTYWKHVGPTSDASGVGHAVGVSLGYKF